MFTSPKIAEKFNKFKIDSNANSIKNHYDNKPFEYKFTSPKEAASTTNATTKNAKSSSMTYSSPR
jgi:hypothetical protein